MKKHRIERRRNRRWEQRRVKQGLDFFSKKPLHLRIRIGDVYEDCAYHPVTCTEVDWINDNVCGISLIDGSGPRSCSLYHCAPKRLNAEQTQKLVEAWKIGQEAVYEVVKNEIP